jgi:disks large protein 1
LQHGEKNLENVTHEEAVATLKATQDRVVLLVAKPETAYLPPPPDVSSTPPPPRKLIIHLKLYALISDIL